MPKAIDDSGIIYGVILVILTGMISYSTALLLVKNVKIIEYLSI